jgi:hypothetical protein
MDFVFIGALGEDQVVPSRHDDAIAAALADMRIAIG